MWVQMASSDELSQLLVSSVQSLSLQFSLSTPVDKIAFPSALPSGPHKHKIYLLSIKYLQVIGMKNSSSQFGYFFKLGAH